MQRQNESLREGLIVRVGVSSCLLGERVRWDGGHKREEFVVSRLARFVRLVPVCPEMEIGLGAPREPLELVRTERGMRLRGREGDLTDAMNAYAERRISELEPLGLSGYVFKKGSPSCGVTQRDRGLFAARWLERNRELAAIDEEGLRDEARREMFLERVFAHGRFRAWRGDLAGFHAREVLLVLAHDAHALRELDPRALRRELYRARFLSAIASPVRPEGHVRALEYGAARLRERLPENRRRELERTIDEYRVGRVPLGKPSEILRSAAEELDDRELANQSYFEPYPIELRDATPSTAAGGASILPSSGRRSARSRPGTDRSRRDTAR